MAVTEKLNEIATRHKTLLADLEREMKTLGDGDLLQEKEHLASELEKLTAEYNRMKNKLKAVSEENAGLKNRLYEQIYTDKVKIVDHSAQKMDIYFQTAIKGEKNQLAKLEATVKARIEKIKKILQSNRVEAQDEIYQKIEEISILSRDKMIAARTQLVRYNKACSEDQEKELQRLKEEKITEEQIKQMGKKFNTESLVGLNLLNKLGIFLVIIGVIAASQYTYVQLPDMLKGIMMFILGGVLLGAGELLNRKKANVFSLGITAGGVGVLYVALSVSYFWLGILGVYPALGLCMLITAVAFLLSTRYKSQTILIFALIGGYLPIFSIGGNMVLIYAAVVYFVVLNLLALFISMVRKWTVSAFVGLVLNMGGTLYICFNLFDTASTMNQFMAIGYIVFAFLIYTLIPILGTYKEKLKFKTPDVVLISINTLFSSFMMYVSFFAFDISHHMGLLSIFFAVAYLLMGRLIGLKFSEEKKMENLFYLTGLAFAILTVPFQFGIEWLSMGWLVEGTVLLVYGIFYKEKVFHLAGLVISGLCLVSFVLIDVTRFWSSLFEYKYFAVTLASLVILWALIYKNTLYSAIHKIYKYAVMVHFWIYIQFVIYYTLGHYVDAHFTQSYLNLDYLVAVLAIAATFAVAFVYPRVKFLSDGAVKGISASINIIGVLNLIFLQQGDFLYMEPGAQNVGVGILGAVIIVVISLLSIVALNEVIRYSILEWGLSITFYPLILSAYFVVILTGTLINQYNMAFSSALISILYVLTALVCTVMGFMRSYSYLRQFGLALALLSVLKLFLVDFYALTQGYKIITYFTLGITLIGISFIYQYFNKRLESKQEGSNNEESH